MAHYGRLDSGVPDPDGRGYLGTLNVYHELHCLKRLHQYTYTDYYFRDLTHELNRLHNEDCIDFLRRSSMCHVGRSDADAATSYHSDKRGEEEPVYRRSNDNAATA
ncbi:hypothetical protein G3M48_004564 [Beauveria asiatica]|uniref:Uncharacterized protein n=1 Tax=Beauveria asiatica TaxID=1069075 RepID=A0AAW0S8E4_9HYPO